MHVPRAPSRVRKLGDGRSRAAAPHDPGWRHACGALAAAGPTLPTRMAGAVGRLDLGVVSRLLVLVAHLQAAT